MLVAVLTHMSHACPQKRGNLFCWLFFVYVWLFVFFFPSPWFSFAQQKGAMVQVQRKHGPGYKKKVRFEMDCCRVSFFGYFFGGGSRGLGVGVFLLGL